MMESVNIVITSLVHVVRPAFVLFGITSALIMVVYPPLECPGVIPPRLFGVIPLVF